MIDAYFDDLRAVIAASPVVRLFSLHTERRSDEIGFLRGDLSFSDGSRLHFREYVRQAEGASAERYTYTYRFQRADGTLVFRYDNTPHYPDLPNAPHHKHDGGEANVISASAPNLAAVLKEIESLIAVE